MRGTTLLLLASIFLLFVSVPVHAEGESCASVDGDGENQVHDGRSGGYGVTFYERNSLGPGYTFNYGLRAFPSCLENCPYDITCILEGPPEP